MKVNCPNVFASKNFSLPESSLFSPTNTVGDLKNEHLNSALLEVLHSDNLLFKCPVPTTYWARK